MPAFAPVLVLLLTTSALAQDEVVPVPRRTLPATVLNEVRLLENRFDVALAGDCSSDRCFSKGCVYVDHTVADRRRSSSLPGLGGDDSPDPEAAQAYLTRARCAFTVEPSVTARDGESIAQRLRDKLTNGWLVVDVVQQRLRPLPRYLQEPIPDVEPEPEETDDTDVPHSVEPEPEPEPPLTFGRMFEQLWATLLPHLAWMIALLLGTLAVVSVIWAWRRVGQQTLEERMLLAELENGGVAGEPEEDAPAEETAEERDQAYVAEQRLPWVERLSEDEVDPGVTALIRDRLLARDFPLLAKAVLTFPEAFPRAFPAGVVGGDLAAAKLELASYLQEVDPENLPEDPAFFRSLERHALAARVLTQTDAQAVRALDESFGAAGLAGLLAEVPARPAALLFALAPAPVQQELVRLVAPDRLARMAEELLRSDRVSAHENAQISAILTAAQDGSALPSLSQVGDVSDRGEVFEAAGPLSVLLEALHPDRRTAIFQSALERFGGSLPGWVRGVLVSDMLSAMNAEDRADLLLGMDARPLAAWLGLLDGEARARVLDGLPMALLNTVRAESIGMSAAEQQTLAARGRKVLAAGFQGFLSRADLSFESIVVRGAR